MRFAGKNKWQSLLEETPVDDMSEEADWELKKMAGRRRSLSKAEIKIAEEAEKTNPEFAADLRIQAAGHQMHGDELNLFRQVKESGIRKVPESKGKES